MVSHTTATPSEAKTSVSASPAASPQARSPSLPESRPEFEGLVDVEFARYREMREEVRKQFTQLRRSVIAKYPN